MLIKQPSHVLLGCGPVGPEARADGEGERIGVGLFIDQAL